MRHIPHRLRGCYIGFDTFDDSAQVRRPGIPPGVGGGAAPAPQFAGIVQPATDFRAVRDMRRTTPLYYTVDLSTARSIAAGTSLRLDLNGNSFYSDPVQDGSGNNIAGYATVHFQDVNLSPQGTPFTVGPQFIAKVPFTQLLIENYAQAGKQLRIAYGVDIDFSPGLNASVTIGGVVNAALSGTAFGSKFSSVATLAAGATELVLAAASNLAGLRVVNGHYVSRIGAGGFLGQRALHAHTGAPAAYTDGDLLTEVVTHSGPAADDAASARVPIPLLIATGKGLWFRNSGAAGDSDRAASCNYTILT